MKKTQRNTILFAMAFAAVAAMTVAYLEAVAPPRVCEKCGGSLEPLSDKYPNILKCKLCPFQVQTDYQR